MHRYHYALAGLLSAGGIAMFLLDKSEVAATSMVAAGIGVLTRATHQAERGRKQAQFELESERTQTTMLRKRLDL